MQRARDGTVTLLPDGHTARFTPAPNYNGAASFRMIARDQSLGTRVLFLYDFEPPDVATDAKSTDQSNFNRTGTLEVAGVGGEYAYTADVPRRAGALEHAIAQPQRSRHRRARACAARSRPRT